MAALLGNDGRAPRRTGRLAAVLSSTWIAFPNGYIAGKMAESVPPGQEFP